ncbi:hypothetical protein [Nonomuraea dietziae]|uniref:hypothetical protein n=1 Tax=Nonomuraea dietziae TaxID=65515 RepID=UPI0033BFD261
MTDSQASDGPTPEFLELIEEKKTAVHAFISIYLEALRGKTSTDEVDRLLDAVHPDLSDRSELGNRAIATAYSQLVVYLLHELAEARGQRVEQAWQQVSVEKLNGNKRWLV